MVALSNFDNLLQEYNYEACHLISDAEGVPAIEGNTLSEEQITALLDGKRVIAPPREIQEAKNAIAAMTILSNSQSLWTCAA